ncbi:MAG: hypothetical protein FJW30_11935, partial [Acidobacteria bacterium]|nr:hypothetical protein [Acidobacteriota bacterium]
MIEPSYLGASRRPLGMALLVIVGLALAGAFGALWIFSSAPEVQVKGDFPRVLTRSTPMELEWRTDHGARLVSLRLEQDGVSSPVFENREETARWMFWRKPGGRARAALTIGTKQVPSLRPGKATVVIEVQSNDFRGQIARLSKELPVVLESPKVTPDTEPVFFRRGGTGIVTFTAGGGWSEAGVRVGPYHFPSYPLKGRPERRVSLFACPPTVDARTEPVIYARNQAGEEAESAFPHRMTGAKFRDRVMDLGEGFLLKIFDELDGAGTGPAAERFLRINAAMRRENDAALARLAVRTENKPLWKGAFQLLPRG